MIYFFFFKPSFESGAAAVAPTTGYDPWFYDAWKKRREERDEDDIVPPATEEEIAIVEEIIGTAPEVETPAPEPTRTLELNRNIEEFSKLSLKLAELQLNLQKLALEEELRAKMLEAERLFLEERARIAKLILMMQEEEEAMFLLLLH